MSKYVFLLVTHPYVVFLQWIYILFDKKSNYATIINTNIEHHGHHLPIELRVSPLNSEKS